MPMAEARVQRRLAAIFAADVAGYSRMVAHDEEGTLRTLGLYRAVIAELIAEHDGRVFNAAGDSVLAEFASAVQAVRAAVAMQRALQRRNADLPAALRMEFRVGLNLGDVVAEGDDLLGDGINVAARLQELAPAAGICLSGALREQTEGKLTFPLVALGAQTLKNIPRPVTIYRVDWEVEGVTAAGMLGGGAPSLPDKPSIAVLPFANMSGDPDQEYFADGITEDIITALSHYRWFFVIARNSTFAYKKQPGVDVKQVGRELGVRYVLEGSVRKAGNRIRATAQLVEAETGNHVWAERFDRDLADIFALQDEITQSVVGAVEPEMQIVEGRRATRKSASNLDAFDCWMRGVWHFHHLSDADQHREAETWYRRAIEIDPRFSPAHMSLARVLNHRVWWGWSTDIEGDTAAGHAEATRAVALDDRDPYGHYALALLNMLRRQHGQSLAEAQRSIDLSPNFSLGYFALGWLRIYMGNFDEAIDSLLRCLRLSPNDQQAGGFIGQMAMAHYHLGHYEDAVRDVEQARRRRRIPFLMRTLIAGLGQLGRTDEAAIVRAELARFDPPNAAQFWMAISPYADPAHHAHLRDGLRKAGMTNEEVQLIGG
jgi:TolB-like protein/class 3 adenylate cyclase